MGGISTGIGLMSGIDTATLIERLLAIEARPKVLAINRQIVLQNEKAAFTGLNSMLVALRDAAAAFASSKIFETKTATSSDAAVMTASAQTNAAPGTYQFLVHRLVSTNQQISQGFVDSDSTQMGGTEISFEWGQGRVTTDTQLSVLNGGEGISRGKISITDTDNNNFIFDLSTAVTVNDILDAINAETSISVTASVAPDGSGLVITDTGSGDGSLSVADVTGYTMATELGIKDSVSGPGATITGTQINSIGLNTALSRLNDGNGIQINTGIDSPDFMIQENGGAGDSYDIFLGKYNLGVDLDEDGEDDYSEPITTLQGLKDRIEDNTENKFTIEIAADGQSIKIVDVSAGWTNFEVEANTLGTGTYQGAADLGIVGTAVGTELAGSKIYAGINSVLMKSLNGGSGLNSQTALNLEDRAGQTASLTLGEDASLSEIIDQINNAATNLVASMNPVGNGIMITDSIGGGGVIRVEGDAAIELGFDTGVDGVAADSVTGTNLQLQYISEATKLEDLNNGKGIGEGSFRITDGEGQQATIQIGDDDTTLLHIIEEINSAPGIDIIARINDDGDGIIIEDDTDSPVSAMKVERISGTTAKDLNILGEASSADPADNYIDGSYERKITLETTDTLQDVIDKVNAAGIDVTATLINDGTAATPFHISFTSKIAGSVGDLIIDTTGFDLDLIELNKAQDAVVFFGSDDPANAILMTSSTNTLDNLIDGVTIDLHSTSDIVTNLTIAENTTRMVEAVQTFIDSFNQVAGRLSSLDSYDLETKAKGVLLGNPTLSLIRSRIYTVVQGKTDNVDTQYEYLNQVGIRIGGGGKLVFDSDRLREALAEDPEAVKNLFAARVVSTDQDLDLGEGATTRSEELLFDSLGVAEQLGLLLKSMTGSIDGTLARVDDNYDELIRIQEKRIENFERQLEGKRDRLRMEFADMELALAAIQAQQSALSSIGF